MEHTDLGTAVTASLRAAIISGEIPAGDRLVETELAAQFGVSRGPVRDALAELQRSGLVELRARKGSFVRSLSTTDIDEVYTLRIALESLAIGRIADDPRKIERHGGQLRALVAELEAARYSEDNMAVGLTDMAIHRGIVEAAGHGRLQDAWERLADQTLLMMTGLSTINLEAQSPAGHASIIEHALSGRTEDAVTALVEHLERARHIMMEHFDS